MIDRNFVHKTINDKGFSLIITEFVKLHSFLDIIMKFTNYTT